MPLNLRKPKPVLSEFKPSLIKDQAKCQRSKTYLVGHDSRRESFLIEDSDDVNDGDVAMTMTDMIIATSPLLT